MSTDRSPPLTLGLSGAPAQALRPNHRPRARAAAPRCRPHQRQHRRESPFLAFAPARAAEVLVTLRSPPGARWDTRHPSSTTSRFFLVDAACYDRKPRTRQSGPSSDAQPEGASAICCHLRGFSVSTRSSACRRSLEDGGAVPARWSAGSSLAFAGPLLVAATRHSVREPRVMSPRSMPLVRNSSVETSEALPMAVPYCIWKASDGAQDSTASPPGLGAAHARAEADVGMVPGYRRRRGRRPRERRRSRPGAFAPTATPHRQEHRSPSGYRVPCGTPRRTQRCRSPRARGENRQQRQRQQIPQDRATGMSWPRRADRTRRRQDAFVPCRRPE